MDIKNDSRQKRRVDLSPEEQNTLTLEWENGMRSTGKLCIQKIKGMAEKLDCSIDRVKMWIGNKNARERSVGTIDYSKKKTATKRGPSAYNIVTGDIPRGNMTGSEYLRKAAEVWRGASAEQKQLATEKAKKIKMDPLQNMDSEQAINHHLKIISKSCDIIASLGLQVGGVCVTKDKVPSYFGTPKAMSFFKDNIIEIVDSLTGEEQTIKSEKPKRLALKEEVRKVFNASFEKCGMKKVPYKALSLGQISFSVSGLPEGITFKEPGSYSTSTMESILSRKDQIHVAKISREETIEEKVIANKGNESIGSQSEKVKANKESESIDSQSEKVIANKGNESIGSQSGTTVQQTDSEGSIQEYCAERIVSEISSPLGLIEMVHDSEQLDPPYIPADIAEETLFAIVGESSTENIELKPEFREEKLYIVEEILACKKIKNKKQYYIKWEGYSSESNSWEPAVNIPKTLITNFNKKK